MSPKVYIAGPYTVGDVAENVARAIEAWHLLTAKGYNVYCPHLSHFLHLHKQLPWERWLELDLVWMSVCDVVVRLPGESKGADLECEHARNQGIPVKRLEDLV